MFAQIYSFSPQHVVNRSKLYKVSNFRLYRTTLDSLEHPRALYESSDLLT